MIHCYQRCGLGAQWCRCRACTQSAAPFARMGRCSAGGATTMGQLAAAARYLWDSTSAQRSLDLWT